MTTGIDPQDVYHNGAWYDRSGNPISLGGGSSSIYYGQIIGQCGLGIRNAGVKSLITKSRHQVYQDSSTLDLRFPNYITTATGDQIGNGAITVISVAIENLTRAPGVMTQCTWNGGQTTNTIADGGQSDAMDATSFAGIKEGDFIMVRVLQNNANGCVVSGSATSAQDAANGEQSFWSGTLNAIIDVTSTVATYNAGNTGGTSTSNWTFRPVLGLGYTDKRSHLGGYTDSRDAYAGYAGHTYTGATGDLGRMGRFFGQFAAYSMMGVGGDTIAAMATASRPWVTFNAKFFTDFHISGGYNDKPGASDATVYANQKLTAARVPSTVKYTWLWTQNNKTTTTDTWATGTNQTISVDMSGANTLLKAGSSAIPAYRVIDAQALSQPSGKFKFNGTASNDTPDGIHDTSVANLELATELLPIYAPLLVSRTERIAPIANAEYRFAYTITNVESGAEYSNANATATTGQTVFTLPTPIKGKATEFTFTVKTTDGIRVNLPAGVTLRNAAAVSTAAGNWQSATVGDSIKVKAVSPTEYYTVANVGSGGTLA